MCARLRRSAINEAARDSDKMSPPRPPPQAAGRGARSEARRAARLAASMNRMNDERAAAAPPRDADAVAPEFKRDPGASMEASRGAN
jgi:hypothetical protein